TPRQGFFGPQNFKLRHYLSLAGIDFGPFDPDVRTYAALVGDDATTTWVMAIPNATDARVRVTALNRQTSTTGRLKLETFVEPTTMLRIEVTSPDNSSTATYEVAIGRGLAITGEPSVGQILTADTSGVVDADGLHNEAYSYQWIRNDGSADSDIFGATSKIYILKPRDEGRTIKVRVNFTDDLGNIETRTSAGTPKVLHSENVVVWESEFTPALSADVSPVAWGFLAYGDDTGSLSPDRIEIDGTTYRVHNLTHSSGGLWLGMYKGLPTNFTLIVDGSAYRGSESMVHPTLGGEGYWWPSPTPDWSAGEPVRVGLVVYPGIPLGDRPKAPVTGYFRLFPSEHDGHEDFSFRIHFNEGVATTADALRDHVLSVSGGTVSGVEAVGSEGRIWHVWITPGSHAPVTIEIEADVDCALPSAVCSADGRRLFNRMELTVEPRDKNPPTGAPTISGKVDMGETLTADTSGIADADGLTGATFAYQWVSYYGRVYTDIAGATDSTYTVAAADEGKAFKVRVTFVDDAGNRQSLTSALAHMGRPYGLTASESDSAVELTWKLPAGWPYGSLFQVLRHRPERGETEPLVHFRFLQTSENAYTDTDVEPGVLYVYRVKGVDTFGFAHEASGPFEIRTGGRAPDRSSPATGAPVVRGVVKVGKTLTADTSGISDEDGLDDAAFRYQWLADDTEISGATESTYTLEATDEGKAIRVRVSFTDDEDNEETLTSTATTAVEPATPITASIHDEPESHDSQTSFTFEVRFSQEFGISYRTLRDHAFTVTGGRVESARRLERDSDEPNRRWEITIAPDSGSDVTIVLPITTNCGDEGAICTAGGRMLSNRLEFTVSESGG
ncbi:MAG: hypothetical protein F4X27_16365, partial [Chloroflexi bacterium]|nr:hypothetical protein [Chloroflexota bacterium]